MTASNYRSVLQGHTVFEPHLAGYFPPFGGLGDASALASVCAQNTDPQCPCSSGFAAAAQPGGQGAQLAMQLMNIGAAATTSALAASSAASANDTPVTKGTLAVPIIGAAIAAVTAVVGFFVAKNQKYHAEETATTGIVNQAEVLMKQNLSAWQSETHTQSAQEVCLQNFCTVWNEVVKACNQTQYAAPGQRCVSDRQRGGKTDWFSYYFDPIANAADIVPDPTAASTVSGAAGAAEGAVNTLAQDIGINTANLPPWFIPAVLGAVVLVAVI